MLGDEGRSGTMPGSMILQPLSADSPASPRASRSRVSMAVSDAAVRLCAPLPAGRDAPCRAASSFSRSAAWRSSVWSCLRISRETGARVGCLFADLAPASRSGLLFALGGVGDFQLGALDLLFERGAQTRRACRYRPRSACTGSAASCLRPGVFDFLQSARGFRAPAAAMPAHQVLIAFAGQGAVHVHCRFAPEYCASACAFRGSGSVAEISRMRVLRTSRDLEHAPLERFDGAARARRPNCSMRLLKEAVAGGELLVSRERFQIDRADRHGGAQSPCRPEARSRCAR